MSNGDPLAEPNNGDGQGWPGRRQAIVLLLGVTVSWLLVATALMLLP